MIAAEERLRGKSEVQDPETREIAYTPEDRLNEKLNMIAVWRQ